VSPLVSAAHRSSIPSFANHQQANALPPHGKSSSNPLILHPKPLQNTGSSLKASAAVPSAMDLNNIKKQVSNLTLYDLKAGVRKMQNGKVGC
jgi:hypothetical protein